MFYTHNLRNFKCYSQVEKYIIDTNINSKIKIPVYDNQTFIYIESKNKVNPTLKATIDIICYRNYY